ncbi:4-hydroxyphenylpyruvate dioxygenase [Hyella patelloides LEGE 07179]|uniref:4-hydroxyphenylpyruvate dioxygenase n=1 Tax=Hyella patelloides LEGE 07179 TaxID=945734 RepID=A0A563W582_9CYAN|nr:4-hydroxyphenylpyruvate dioxygenase [Hyella patelloides]VEP18834.1 4-hydroxyphenylpyruvate dioxygenase [Hyella patelloides LEGE 07179]
MEIDSVHFYVTDATNTSNWFINCLGFKLVDSYRDDDSLTIAIANKSIFLVISSPINNHGVVAHYLASHAEGIVDIAFRVNQLQPIVNNAQHSGIKILQPIQQLEKIKYACFAGWNCLQHTVIESLHPSNCYRLPNSKLRRIRAINRFSNATFTFTDIDHIVLNVGQGKLDQAVAYYQSLLNFQIQQTFQINTKRSGLSSQALIDTVGKVQFNINEPTTTNSQIQEFIDLNGGAGIQHLALKSANLIQDVAKMRSLGVPFLPIPLAYYTHLKQRLKRDLIQFSVRELQSIIEQSILIDWHHRKSNSLLMQLFTQPILKQPTFFLEFIERRQQAKGFGEGNFNALFAAVEQSSINN